ncbi:uncharacterized protein LOC131650342 [Vicia villosa]|uniref:uncharacterized protein LOC131650342 n=1 Tax=Vicia villosa TaxID=3911 RepID=UPI00273BFE72|nr:uncharacterized protein LOC131650342 [Vicia villosa]
MFPKAVVCNDVKHNAVKDNVKPVEVKHDVKPEEVKDDVKPIVVEIDVSQRFINRHLFTAREHMLQWIRMVGRKLGFGIVIGRSDNGSNRRQTFVTMRCEQSGMYVPQIRKSKREDTRKRKCGCRFKMREYCNVDEMWKFNVISGTHNHAYKTKLVGHPIVCRLKLEEKKNVSNMSLIRVAPEKYLQI